MSSNTENTEAKLAAYIDGQLDPAERAQIEQFLQANPDHRKLLADMVAQRDVLRSLPRDKAPADIYDAIQAQLERSVLLDDSAQAATPAVRHSRRSALFAIAAILFLAIGLGGVLYFALPSTRHSSLEVASSNQPTAPPAGETAVEQAPAAARARLRAKSTPTAPALAEAPAPSLTPGSVSNSVPASPIYQALAAGSAAAQSASDAGQLVLLVSTTDPSKVNQQVETYLDSNKIRWEAVNAPTDQIFYSRAGAGGGGASFGAAQQPVQQKAEPAPAETIVPPAAVAPSQGSRSPADAELAKKSESDKAATGQLEGADASVSKEQLADVSSQAPQQKQTEQLTAPAAAQASTAPYQGVSLSARLWPNLSNKSKDASGQQYIIARGMTRQQAVQLTDSLSSDRPTQRARLIGQVPGRAKLERQDVAQAVPQTQATTTQASPGILSADADGDGIAVQQLRAQPLQQQLRPQAQVSESHAAQQVATTGQAAVDHVGPAQSATTAPTTQGEPGLDVVILVEDESTPTTAPTTTTAPATAPATEPALEY